MTPKKGFTLIELLVVIAIIGILASIVLVSLGGARGKARDARITSDMSQIRTKAELINAAENSYSKLDPSAAAPSGCGYDTEMTSLCNDIDKQCPTGTAACGADDADGGTQDVVAHASATLYCVYTPLNVKYGAANDYYCMDSTGVAGNTTTAPGGVTFCDGTTFYCPTLR